VTLRHILRRAPWWLAALWVLTIAAALARAWVGDWLAVLVLVVIGWLSVYGEAQHQRATDAEADRDDLSRHVDRLNDRLVRGSVLHAARNPRADWED
jgi:hypothetical protein